MAHDRARIWFFTDIHGSTACFRKFLNLVSNENRPNVLVVGGDITGKKIIPIVEDDEGNCVTAMHGRQHRFNVSKIDDVISSFADVGYYAFRCNESEHRQFQFDESFRQQASDRLIRQRLEEWVA